MNLPTKDVVTSSVLSKTWRNLWRYVPALELDDGDFPCHKTFVSFVDAFLGFNSESYFENFKLKFYGENDDDGNRADIGVVSRWINIVIDWKVKHLHVWYDKDRYLEDIQMPPKIYTCESLVSLKLRDVDLGSLKFVSLPSLKVMDLTRVQYANILDLETLIRRCRVLESLSLYYDPLEILRVWSRSLFSFTLVRERSHTLDPWDIDSLVVAIYAPRLQYLRLDDYRIAKFILINRSSLVKAYIGVAFNWRFESKFQTDLQNRMTMRSFLEGISCVKDMTIASKTLEVIYHYSRREQLPLFHGLSFLRVIFANYIWEMLPIFLESCPNLKSLVVASTDFPQRVGISSFLSKPRCLLSSLEYVDIERPVEGEAMEMKLLSYFLENSAILKKLTVCFDASMETQKRSAILKELITRPRLSSSCQVVIL